MPQQDLAQLARWTARGDTVQWQAQGVGLVNRSRQSGLGGNDLISVNGVLSPVIPALENQSDIAFGSGNSRIALTLRFSSYSGGLTTGALFNTRSARITTTGNMDIEVAINAYSPTVGLFNQGVISATTAGSLRVNASNVTSTAIFNTGYIIGGDRNDSITGTTPASSGSSSAIITTAAGGIDLKGGNDIITGTTITGSGQVNALSRPYDILMGAGNDVLRATNSGLVSFLGLSVDMGSGDDTAIGFGDSRLQGGSGRDTLRVPRGTYTVFSTSQPGWYGILPSTSNQVMYISGFEAIGAIDGSLSGFRLGSQLGAVTI